MSEFRRPDEIIIHRLPGFAGKKQGENCHKYELFDAVHWALDWTPWDKNYFPAPPLHGLSRRDFWLQMYRVRKDGKWLGDEAKYRFYSRREIADMVFTRNSEE